MSSTEYPNNMKYFIQLSQAIIITDIFHRNFISQCTLYYTQNNNCCDHCLIIRPMVCLEYDWVRIRLAYCVDKKNKSIVNSIDNYHASNQTLQVGLQKHWSHQSHGKKDVTSHYIKQLDGLVQEKRKSSALALKLLGVYIWGISFGLYGIFMPCAVCPSGLPSCPHYHSTAKNIWWVLLVFCSTIALCKSMSPIDYGVSMFIL